MKRKLMSLVLCAAMVGSMVGVTTTVHAEDEINIEIVSKGFQHQFWQAVKKGAENKEAELGCKINFVGPNSESDIADQVQMLNSAINQKPDAIAFAALDTEASLDAIKQAQEAGIPIIGFDSGVPGAPEGAILANAATTMQQVNLQQKKHTNF